MSDTLQPSVVSLYELETGWARTADQLRHLRWELLACDEVIGVFSTTRGDVLAVLFTGDRKNFDEWAHSLRPSGPHLTRKGALS